MQEKLEKSLFLVMSTGKNQSKFQNTSYLLVDIQISTDFLRGHEEEERLLNLVKCSCRYVSPNYK